MTHGRPARQHGGCVGFGKLERDAGRQARIADPLRLAADERGREAREPILGRIGRIDAQARLMECVARDERERRVGMRGERACGAGLRP